ncbi:uncharacterized protein RHIMIDRAFT_266672 [Rhizopus microsporus ATCC 52813]|uniref:Uncharacterized protein n=1 Tax=Rhizopus microsporus ATCC 52813 TaxID=1340429 RepID=A0A2G4T6P9_RHIZD|nr:uncharacterized protein RHIMIDRAFT_266672 [Rhizopus microsporus ATCC 52813]PHZ16694.1 hypothetical protein RHIMIDRAFT_266672 [Rhizopus microsporus ATCC 52813]
MGFVFMNKIDTHIYCSSDQDELERFKTSLFLLYILPLLYIMYSLLTLHLVKKGRYTHPHKKDKNVE